MSLTKTILWVTAAVATATATVVYAFRLKRTSAELETYAKINIFKLNLTELVVQVDVRLKNPTATKFSIKFPFVKLIYKGLTVGSSQVQNKDIAIPAYGEAVAEKIMIPIPTLEEFSLVTGLIESLLLREQVKISVAKITTIDLGLTKIPYAKTEELILKK